MSHMSLNIIHSSESSRNLVQAYLLPYADTITVSGTADSLEAGAGILHKTSPNLVLLEVNDVQKGVREVSYITNTFPRTSVIVSSPETNAEWILSLMRAGAVEYLVQPIREEDLKQTLQKVGRFILPGKQAAPKRTGKVISVYYPTGGMGTTTIAVNLACALATGESKVALLDLNVSAGDLSTFLNMDPPYTLSSVTRNIERLDLNFLMSAMTRHPSGPYVLTEPKEPSEAGMVTAEQVQRILDLMRKNFDYVIADCGGPLAGITSHAFLSSDLILFTTALTLPTLKNTKRYLPVLERLGVGGKVKLVVNRASAKAGIQLKDAQKVLDREIFHTIPNEFMDVVASINKGEPLVRLLPRSPVSRSIAKLAECVRNSSRP